MDPRYSALQACIYTNTSELDRFRQLVVNTVMATGKYICQPLPIFSLFDMPL